MADHDEAPVKQLDPAANDLPAESSRNGAKKRRDPNQPSAVIGIGASAGGVAALQQFFGEMDPESGLAFVVVMHLSPEFESRLADVLQQKTKMPVTQVNEPVKVKPNNVYVIPPLHQLTFTDSTLTLVEPQQPLGKRVTIDLFFRTLAQAYGQRAVCVIMSGTDSDGVIGLKHIRAQGGLTIAQDPNEAEFDSMPASAISTGMVDWVLPVAQMPAKLLEFVRNERRMKLPPEIPEADEPDAKVEDAPGGETVSDETREPEHEEAISKILADVRAQTGHDFSHYKRATVLRRIARRLQVNSIETLPEYLEFIRTHPAEGRALLQDLLIGVTHFFRDRVAFASLEAHIPQLFAGKNPDDEVRVWVAGCASGEEAYSIAMLLCEHCKRLKNPPKVQIFATDVDDEAIADSRDGLYPLTIEADVSPERLREFFAKDHGRYRVRKEIREKVLFAVHDVLKDAPFSRCDLISCRNLFIYLTGEAQQAIFDVFHFALRSGGLLFLGSAENQSQAQTLFSPLDPKHRIFVRRSMPRPVWRMANIPMRPLGTRGAGRPGPRGWRTPSLPALTHAVAEDAGNNAAAARQAGQTRRDVLFGELHLRLLEEYGPPSVVVNELHEIVHLSANAGRYLQFAAGEPTANISKVVNPALAIELRTALFKAARENTSVKGSSTVVEVAGGKEVITVEVRPMRANDQAEGFLLVLFGNEPASALEAATLVTPDAIVRGADEEIAFLKEQLANTIEQYESTNEELKASNEELQAMNEEMRSAAEELETSKEELQSVNEELTTVNYELKASVEELSRTNADLNNLMASTDIGTIFLDRELRVHRFTPSAQKIFNLIPADLGRPISDITSRLHYDGFQEDLEGVLRDLSTIEREVRVGEGGDVQWYLIRIAPYRSAEDRIAGVVATFINITRRKEAEDASRETEARLRRAIQIESVGVFFFHVDGPITEANDAFLQLSGYTREDLKNGLVRWDRMTPEEWMALTREEMDRFRRTGKIGPYEKQYIRKDGTRWWGLFTGTRLGENLGVEYVLDISDRKSAEQALRRSEERFRVLVEGASDYAMFLLDPENTITFWSAGAEKIFGWSQEEAVGQSGAMIFTPEDRKRGKVEEEINTALNDGRALDRRFHLRKDGSRFWTDGVLMRIDDEAGKLRGFAKVARDATDQRRVEDELAHSRDEMEQRVVERTRELVAMNNELERAMQQRQQLERELLEISEREKRRVGEDLHDMVCQELTATALFLQSSAKKMAKENLAAAKTLAESAETVNRNVVLARSLAGGLQAIELSASGLKHALRELAAQACENTGIKCHLRVARGVRVRDDTVALHLYRVAQEAVTNAVKHSGAKNVLISLDHDKTHVCVSVQDDGKGFSVEKRRKGKGLGLHMMRYRANALGGELRIERRKTGGMDVTCKIPVKR
jgi:two-component system, chemotaxis family, CheB/CheR fusion protein